MVLRVRMRADAPLWMGSRLVPLIAAFMRAHGKDPSNLLASFQVSLPEHPTPDHPGAVLPIRVVRDFLAAAAAEVMVPHLGVAVAVWAPRGEYGVVEFAARSAPTLRAAVQRVVRYQRLVNNVAAFSIEDEPDGTVSIRHRIAGEPQCVGPVGNEYTIAYLWRMSQEICGATLAPVRVSFAHFAPSDSSGLTEHFAPATTRFGVGFNELAFDGATVDHPLVTRDDLLLPVLDRYAALLLPPPEAPDTLLGRIRREIGATLDGDVLISTIAPRLHMSPRTLQRRLAQEHDTSFSSVLDRVRRDRSNALLGDEQLSLSEICFLLGYADQRSFFRAFKRWTGMTPQEFRRRSRT